jgi:RNA polymerase sigma-70 factor, ECF subfamily
MTLPHQPGDDTRERLTLEGAGVKRERTQAEQREFEAMFRAHYAALCCYVRRLVESMAIAEDIAQDVFARIWEREPSFVYENARTFLFVAAKRLALNYLRRQQVATNWSAQEMRSDPRTAESAAQSVEREDLAKAVRAAVDRLPPMVKAIYRLQREAGMSYSEIARELGLSVKTVDGHMGRAIRMLRASLAGYLAIVAAVGIGS